MIQKSQQVEDVVENLCVLTHLRDHLQTMGGQLIKGAKHDDDDGGEDEEDYSRFNYGAFVFLNMYDWCSH